MNTSNKYKVVDFIQIYLADVFVLVMSFITLAYMRGMSDWLNSTTLSISLSILIPCIYIFYILFKAHRCLWRYSGAGDYIRFIAAYGFGYLIASLILSYMPYDISKLFTFSSTITALAASIFMRAATHVLYRRIQIYKAAKAKDNSSNSRAMIILGAGNAAFSLIDDIKKNNKSPYTVKVALDDDPRKLGREINGVHVGGIIKDLPKFLEQFPGAIVVLAIPSLSIDRRREIIEFCSALACQFRIIPDTIRLLHHETNIATSLRSVKIEDLISRSTVSFDIKDIEKFAAGKTILITGGGGSIGSEICRQLAETSVKKLVIFDINENDTHMLACELNQIYKGGVDLVCEIGSITDRRRVDEVFRNHKPEIVFHAAAHKHVPLMEHSPYEAVNNNIFGTYNVLRTVRKYSVAKFVMISTDKAVNPTSIMGATKRYCEMMCRAMACEPDCKTDYIAVRFGNVLGSHGSVIPIFQMQIEHGGPITVTDRRITRYFMTIQEAAGLVIKAASMANRSETFILDMGKPEKIWDLAEKFCRLSGYEPHTEMPIIETGLRPGEKLYEELLIDDEKHVSTSVSKIFVEKNSEYVKLDDIATGLAELYAVMEKKRSRILIDGENEDYDREIMDILHHLVPNFKAPEIVNAEYISGTDDTAASDLTAFTELYNANAEKAKEYIDDVVLAAK